MKRFWRLIPGTLAVFFVLFAVGCGAQALSGPSPSLVLKMAGESGRSVLTLHFIDVGQGDSTLIEQDGHFMLLDAGERDKGESVISYLKEQGVTTLDYVIGTHPHSDHIGGMAEVIQSFDVKKVILPAKEHTTKTYENLLDSIAERKLKVTLPKVGNSYELGNASFRIIAPVSSYGEDLNDWSVGIRLTYGETHFVLCGDAEKKAERDMCRTGEDLSANLLKLSHHGSRTSSSEVFMDRVNPDYGVISCGRNNDYGHPHKETLEMLAKRGIQVLQTDELGTIVAVSDGSGISFPENPQTDSQGRKKEDREQYVVNVNTKKFHLPDCNFVTSMKAENKKAYEADRQEMIDMGYEPCQGCNP